MIVRGSFCVLFGASGCGHFSLLSCLIWNCIRALVKQKHSALIILIIELQQGAEVSLANTEPRS
jgi:ABC-type lipoprotein export system ATPase subunit